MRLCGLGMLGVAMLVISCQKREEAARIATRGEVSLPRYQIHVPKMIIRKELYYAGLRLVPLQKNREIRRSGTEDILVVFKALIYDSIPKTFWLYDISTVENPHNPTKEELAALDAGLPLQFARETVAVIDMALFFPTTLAGTSQTVYRAVNSEGKEFVLKWKEQSNIIDDRVLERLTVFVGPRDADGNRERFANHEVDHGVFFGGYLWIPMETVMNKYFPEDAASENADTAAAFARTKSALEKHRANDLTALCGEPLNKFVGANGYVVGRPDCGKNLLIRIRPWLYTRFKEKNITCKTIAGKGIRLFKDKKEIFKSGSCSEERLLIRTRTEQIDERKHRLLTQVVVKRENGEEIRTQTIDAEIKTMQAPGE